MPADALSDVLRTVHLSGGMFFRVRLRPPFAVTSLGVDQMIKTLAPGARHMLPFHMVTNGPIWFEVEGAEPALLNQGDIIVIPHGADHTLSHEPGTPAISVTEIGHAVSGTPPTLEWGGSGSGEPASALCGFFHFSGQLFNPLLAALPKVLIVRHDPERSPWLAATIERAFSESMAARPGGAALIGRLTELLFVEVVQRHLDEDGGAGWLGALADPVVGSALTLLHAEPSHRWSVEKLARLVGASRSMLTQRFAETVGLSPIRYLAAWRMELAAQRLVETQDPLAQVASEVGYESEAAFNRAFKRHVGEPPASWRRAQLANGESARL